MAIVFELAVNFGRNVAAARAAAQALAEPIELTAGRHRLNLHHSVDERSPHGILMRLTTDHRRRRITPTYAEMAEVGHQHYDLLATFDGYTAAACGWESEMHVEDVDELTTQYIDVVRAGEINGLVLTEAICDRLGLNGTYVPFRPGYRWNPYRGEEPEEGLTLDCPADV